MIAKFFSVLTSSPGTQVTGADTHVGGVDWVAINPLLQKQKKKKKETCPCSEHYHWKTFKQITVDRYSV